MIHFSFLFRSTTQALSFVVLEKLFPFFNRVVLGQAERLRFLVVAMPALIVAVLLGMCFDPRGGVSKPMFPVRGFPLHVLLTYLVVIFVSVVCIALEYNLATGGVSILTTVLLSLRGAAGFAPLVTVVVFLVPAVCALSVHGIIISVSRLE